MKNISFDLKNFIEEITFEMWDELTQSQDIEITEMQYASNCYCEYVLFPQIPIIDSENYSLDGTDETTGQEEALKGIYETTSKLERVIAAYNKVLRKKLKVYDKSKLEMVMGETDLDKPDQFDNRRFE